MVHKTTMRGKVFKSPLHEKINKFLVKDNIEIDKKLIRYDIYGTVAHNLMLHKVGIISSGNLKMILNSLSEILKLSKKNKFVLKESLEDVHLNIEDFIIKKIGIHTGGKIHIGRSRNDQIMVDMRMYLRDETDYVILFILDLIESLVNIGKKHVNTIMPGYTHTQPAQPITFGYWCISHAYRLIRDVERLEDTYKRINLNPLGASAIAGTDWSIDRETTTKLLGFNNLQKNSLDIINSRGEMETELLTVLSMLMLHLSRMSEDLILFSNPSFGYTRFSDTCSTGSSIMPQKRNPDPAEVIRGKTGIIIGYLVQNLSILKNLPSSYNRDMQETKRPVINAVDIVKDSIEIMNHIISTIEVNKEKCLDMSYKEFITSTLLANTLVRELGVSFRMAHNIVGEIIKECIERRISDIRNIPIEMIIDKVNKYGKKDLSENILRNVLDSEYCVKIIKSMGGSSPDEIRNMIMDVKNFHKNKKANIVKRIGMIEKVYKNLEKRMKTFV